MQILDHVLCSLKVPFYVLDLSVFLFRVICLLFSDSGVVGEQGPKSRVNFYVVVLHCLWFKVPEVAIL